jgi:hypothetical protein
MDGSSILPAAVKAAADVTHNQLLAWDEYNGKPPGAALRKIYEHANATSSSIRDWYWRSIDVKRRISWWIRSATFVLVIAGTLLPIGAGFSDSVDIRLGFTQSGVIVLALAGLLQVADRIFGWSSGWIRYITTVSAVETRSRKFELEWASLLQQKNGALTADDVTQMFGVAKQFEEDIVKLQNDETEKWVAEFNTSLAAMGDVIKAQRDSNDQAVTAIRTEVTAANQTGAIEIKLTRAPGSAVTTVDIALDDEPPAPFTGNTWSRVNLKPGQYRIRLKTHDTPPAAFEPVATVVANSTAKLEINLVPAVA